ncbi:MAG: hypothetical protein EOM68_27450 [Spirochaetia bacterium]|nr:hypothetical protein [Spirochaetia bacterium]
MAVQIRTTGLVQVAGIKFVASIMDIIIPEEQPQRSITSPFLYKASTSVVLRDYYTIVAAGGPQHSQPQRQSEQPTEAVVMESSSSESSEKQKVDTNEVLARLKKEMHEKMLKRLPTQKLICDLQENTELPTAFESVEEMNRQVQVVKHGILLGDPMYLMINGRPLPLMA